MRKWDILAVYVIFVSFVSVLNIDAQEEFVNENDCEISPDSRIKEIQDNESDNSDAWYKGGIAEYDCGRYDSATTFFSAAIALEPNHELAKKYNELSEQRLEEQRQAQSIESSVVTLILQIGVGGGAMALIFWYYKKRKK